MVSATGWPRFVAAVPFSAPTRRICGIIFGMEIVLSFSGAGGLDLGLTKAGHRVVWANNVKGKS